MDKITYQECLESKDPVSPQNLPECLNCCFTIRDCLRLTSVEPCECEYYSKYQKEWKEKNEKT